MGSPSKISFVELGPGRGTLCSDFIRVGLELCKDSRCQVAKTFPKFYESLSIHLVEFSPLMRALQASTLGVQQNTGSRAILDGGINVQWHPSLEDVPKSG